MFLLLSLKTLRDLWKAIIWMRTERHFHKNYFLNVFLFFINVEFFIDIEKTEGNHVTWKCKGGSKYVRTQEEEYPTQLYYFIKCDLANVISIYVQKQQKFILLFYQFRQSNRTQLRVNANIIWDLRSNL